MAFQVITQHQSSQVEWAALKTWPLSTSHGIFAEKGGAQSKEIELRECHRVKPGGVPERVPPARMSGAANMSLMVRVIFSRN
jgi:hypothetical protein